MLWCPLVWFSARLWSVGAGLLFLVCNVVADPVHAILSKKREVEPNEPRLQYRGTDFSWFEFSRPDLDSLPRHSRAGLNLPLAVPVGVQVESLGDLAGRRCSGQVLFVGKDEQRHALQVLLVDQLRQLLHANKHSRSFDLLTWSGYSCSSQSGFMFRCDSCASGSPVLSPQTSSCLHCQWHRSKTTNTESQMCVYKV